MSIHLAQETVNFISYQEHSYYCLSLITLQRKTLTLTPFFPKLGFHQLKPVFYLTLRVCKNICQKSDLIVQTEQKRLGRTYGERINRKHLWSTV